MGGWEDGREGVVKVRREGWWLTRAGRRLVIGERGAQSANKVQSGPGAGWEPAAEEVVVWGCDGGPRFGGGTNGRTTGLLLAASLITTTPPTHPPAP